MRSPAGPQVCAYDYPEAWVRRVALNLAAMAARRLRRRAVALWRLGPPTAAPELSPELLDLHHALRALPLGQRQVIVLHHLVGLPVEEMARELRVPAGTVWASASSASALPTRADRHGRPGRGAGCGGRPGCRPRPGSGPGRPRRHHGAHAQHGLHQGWKTYTDTTGNLRFRYPPDWRIVAYPVRGRKGEQYLMLVPPGIAVPAMPPAAFQVSWRPADRSGSARTGWGEPPAWAGCPTAGPIYAPPTTLPPMTGTTSRAGRSTGAARA